MHVHTFCALMYLFWVFKLVFFRDSFCSLHFKAIRWRQVRFFMRESMNHSLNWFIQNTFRKKIWYSWVSHWIIHSTNMPISLKQCFIQKHNKCLWVSHCTIKMHWCIQEQEDWRHVVKVMWKAFIWRLFGCVVFKWLTLDNGSCSYAHVLN